MRAAEAQAPIVPARRRTRPGTTLRGAVVPSAEEIRSQPAAWRRVPEVVADHGHGLPRPGGRVAVIGCGTSWLMASAYAGAQETLGLGETDAFAVSEMSAGRIVCITRSGTTREVLTLLDRLRAGVGPAAPTVAITSDPDAPVALDVGELGHRVVRPGGPEARAADRLLAPRQDALAGGDGPWPAACPAITELGDRAACLGAGLTAWDAGGER